MPIPAPEPEPVDPVVPDMTHSMYHDPYVPIPAPEPEPVPQPDGGHALFDYSKYLYLPTPAHQPEPTPAPEPVDPIEPEKEPVTLYDLNDKVKALMDEIESLKAAAATEASAALIEDYFNVNTEAVTIGAATNFTLVDPFCIEGPSVLDFSLSASFDTNIDMIMVDLMVNGVSVAVADINDDSAPSNLSLIYRGSIPEDSQVVLVVMAD